MTDKPTRARSVTRAEFDAALARIAAMEKASMETHDLMKDMHSALMVPAAGHEKSMLERVARVTIDIESGGRTAAIVIKFAAFLAALGAIWALIIAGRT